MLKDGTVGAVISLGPERHKVPDVRGKTLDDAQQALDEAKLEYGDAVERFDEKVAKGRVISTDPAAGTPLRRNTAVDVIVSKGPRPIKIPDFTGKRADRAETALEKRGFKVDTTEVNSDTVPEGRVVSQSPDSGTGQKGDVISLVVSKGPVLVEVPDVVRHGPRGRHGSASRPPASGSRSGGPASTSASSTSSAPTRPAAPRPPRAARSSSASSEPANRRHGANVATPESPRRRQCPAPGTSSDAPAQTSPGSVHTRR